MRHFSAPLLVDRLHERLFDEHKEFAREREAQRATTLN